MRDDGRTILIVDDDPKVRTLLRRCLEPEGYTVLEAAGTREIEACLETRSVDLITLDLGLGTERGLDIVADLRTKSDVPIIIVSGKGDVIDKVVGLEMGADDYISKPFHVREVLARVGSVLRRRQNDSNEQNRSGPNKKKLVFEGWTADPVSFELKTPDGELCDLTVSDFRLLMVFLGSPRHVLSRDHIMDRINGHEWTPFDRTIDNQVARLRKKIEKDPTNPAIIKTVRGVGYIFTAQVRAS